MELKLDKIQTRAVNQIARKFRSGSRSVLLVSPPGGGKTEMLAAAIHRLQPRKTLFVVHQRELATQTIERLSKRLGERRVTGMLGGHTVSPSADIIVAIVHSLMASGVPRGVDLLALDEAHHYMADKWSDALPGRPQRTLGATATPERADGKPLGGLFDALVQGGSYSELIANGRLVPAHVVRPKQSLGSDWAQNPIDAWARNGGGKAFFFAPSIKIAEHYAEQWNLRKVRASCISQNTPPAERARAMADFSTGRQQIITCVGTMMEGINVPDCRSVILGRRFQFRGTFLQATGRGLRAHPGKTAGIIIDLTGATIRHGNPDQDRKYSLTADEPISGPTRVSEGGESSWAADDPDVVNVPMINEVGHPLELPPPDAQWLKRERKRNEYYMRNLRLHGKETADRMMRL